MVGQDTLQNPESHPRSILPDKNLAMGGERPKITDRASLLGAPVAGLAMSSILTDVREEKPLTRRDRLHFIPCVYPLFRK